jgi:hypothetical protein
MKELLDNVFLLIGAVASAWTLVGLILIYRRLSTNERKLGTSSWGSILMEVLKILATPLLLWLLVWLWFGVAIPKYEQEAPELAGRSRTGTNLLNYVEDPCTVPGLGNVMCDENPNRFGDNGALATGEQASAAAGVPIVAAPTGPQPVLVQGEEALRACYQAWFVSFQVDGASKITAGLPPDGKSSVTDWIPSNSGAAILVIETPVGINNNRGVLTHWLLPAAIELAQEPLKAWHEDEEGTWSVSGTGSWPQNCYVAAPPTQTQTQQVLPPPPAPPSVSPLGGMFLEDGYSNTLFLPEGTQLQWCYQDPNTGNWYACPPNEVWGWGP